jgi:PAS domain S-box-containing protein
MKMKWQLVRKMQLAFSAALALLLVVGVVSYRNNGNQVGTEEWVAHTHEVLATLAGVLSDETEAESARRGYFITSDSVFLRKYETSAAAAYANLARVRQLTVDNAPQQRRLDALDPLITRRLRLLAQLIDSQGNNPSDVAVQVSKTLEGEEIQARVRDLLAEMVGAERILLQSRIAKARASMRLAIFTILLGTGLALGLLGAVLYLLHREITQRTRAEESQRAIDEMFRARAETASDAIVCANSLGNINYFNKAAERTFGYPAPDVLGKPLTVLMPERFQDAHRRGLARYLSTGEARVIGKTVELAGKRKDGTEFPMELSLATWVADGHTNFTGIARDMTERKEAEQALRESEERFRLMVSNVKDYAILMLDPEGRVLSWNEGAERSKGYRAEEIIGQHFSRFYPSEDVERGKPVFELKTAAEQGCFEDESWRVRKDGSRFWANVVITALRDENGRLRGFGKITRDITGRKEAEEALRSSEERLRMAVEAAEIGTWFWNIQRDEISWSEKCRTLLGFTSAAKLTYEVVLNTTHPDDRQRIDQSVKNTLELGVPYDIEYRAVWPDSSVHWIAAKGRAHWSPEGVAVDMQGIVMDVTERKKAQEAQKHDEARERRSVELKRSNDDLQQFAYIAAHDLQEPLRMVASYTQLLAKRYKGRLDSDADEFIAYAVDGAHRMQLLIGDLLAYCRVGTTGKELRETSSEAALEQALLNLQGAVQESGGVVTHDPLPTVVADDAQLVQLFQNVVGNAIKYRSAELPRVHVSAKKNGGNEWIFSLRDNGRGIDPQYFEKIFIMFQRLHGREEFSGTGIGLAVCKKIAERHGGRMWVESEPGKGSTFYFALPERG